MEAILRPEKRLYRVHERDKEPMYLDQGQWLRALGFCLSMTMLGLSFPLGFLLVAVFLIGSFKRHRHEFLLQLFIFCTGTGFYNRNVLPFHPYDIILVLGVIGCFAVKLGPEAKKLRLLIGGYFLVLVGFASLSHETMTLQLMDIRRYLGILAIFVPLLVFKNRGFDIKLLFRLIIGYMIIICFFYLIDIFILSGFFMLPGIPIWQVHEEIWSTWFEPIWKPFQFTFPRKYPHALYLLAIAIYPVIRFIRLKAWQWITFGFTIIVIRTITLIIAFFVTYLTFIGQLKKLIAYTLIILAVIAGLYWYDANNNGDLRIQSTVMQFVGLNFEDEEDLAEFGTGRMAQIIPKVTYQAEQGLLMQGFGFLDKERTTLSEYIINNPLYLDMANSTEVVTDVEVAPVQTVLDIGIIGLIIQTIVYIAIYFIIRKLRYSLMYLCTLTALWILGLSGFAGLNQPDGLFPLGLAIGAILLIARPVPFQQEVDNEYKTE